MLGIFSDFHDAMQELKDFHMDNKDGNTLLGISRALGRTLESVAQGGSSIIKAIGGAIHDTLNGVVNLNEKVVGSQEEVSSKLIESTGHTIKDSTTGTDNMFCGILGGIGGTMQWCLILGIILVMLYINRSTLLKLCRIKTSELLNAPRTHLPTPSTDSDPTLNRLVNHTFTPEQTPTLTLILASFTLHDVSASQKKSDMVITKTIPSQHDHISCSALVDKISPATLFSEKIQRQLSLPATPL